MPRVVQSPQDFLIIGENIHATRVVLVRGKRTATLADGSEAVVFQGDSGERRYLRVPESYKRTQPYQQGHVKHFMIAVQKGIGDDPVEQEEGRAYIHYEVRRQEAAGAHILDLNVDEVSYDLKIQKRAMKWLVRTVQELARIPPSVDSSNAEIIAVGLAEYDGSAGRPTINSAALERLETLDLVKEFNAKVIVTAAGVDGMPSDDQQRVENVSALMEAVRSKEIPLEDVFIDCLVFPISVSPDYGNHYLDAVRTVREKFGDEVHVTGGLSNVSFGLPNRKLINNTFIHLSLEAGIDTGIIDPIQSRIEEVYELDVESESVGIAQDMLLGRDDFCVNYIQAWRQGRLS